MMVGVVDVGVQPGQGLCDCSSCQVGTLQQMSVHALFLPQRYGPTRQCVGDVRVIG